MNLIQISYKYRPVIGGQEVYIERLQKIFREAGWDPKVIQPYQGVQDEDIIPALRIRGPGRFIAGLDEYLFMWMTRVAHQRHRREADVLLVHYAIHARYLRAYRKKTLILSHGVEWHTESKLWFDRLREANARECFGQFPHVVNDTHYLRHMGLQIQPGKGFFQEVAPDVWFIPNCVDEEVFHPVPPDPEVAQYNSILVPRQIVPDRGIHLAIETFALLYHDLPGTNMYIVGNAWDSQYLVRCQRLAESHGISDRVIFKPQRPNETMPPVYSAAKLTLIPTLRREGTSLSALESMACGTPTVVTAVAGLRDLPAVQAEPNPQSLASAILETLRDRDRIGKAQQKRVRETFNLDHWKEAWLRVISRISLKQ